jgi:hypothetical protein
LFVPPALVTQVVQVIVPLPVIVPPPIGEVVAMLVTVPPPAGVAHVPSPRQKVLDEALVPLFRFVTGRLPVTSEFARLTAELVTVCVLPAKCAIPTPGEEATTQVGHVTVFVESERGEENVLPIPVRVKAPPSLITPPFVVLQRTTSFTVAEGGP